MPDFASTPPLQGSQPIPFSSGSAEPTVYRPASQTALKELARVSADQGLDEMLWALIHHDGPLSEKERQAKVRKTADELEPSVERLTRDGRVSIQYGQLHAPNLTVPLDASTGWETEVFDHLQAVVQTIGQRLQAGSNIDRDALGGSTYAFDIWPSHSLQAQVRGQLAELRKNLGALRLQKTRIMLRQTHFARWAGLALQPTRP